MGAVYDLTAPCWVRKASEVSCHEAMQFTAKKPVNWLVCSVGWGRRFRFVATAPCTVLATCRLSS